MNSTSERQHSAERMFVQMRWALLLGAGVLILEHLNKPATVAALALLAAGNLLAHWLTTNVNLYRRFGAIYVQGLRHADAIFVAALALSGNVRPEQICILGVPLLLFEAYSTRSRKRVGILAGLMIGTQVTANLYTGSTLVAAILPSLLNIFGAIAAIVLAGFQAREEILQSRDRRLDSVLECGSALAETRDLRAMLLHMLKAAVRETGATAGYVMLLEDEGSSRLCTEAAFCLEGQFEFPQELEVGFGMSGYVAKLGQPVQVSAKNGERSEVDGLDAEVLSACSVPLLTRGYSAGGVANTETTLGVLTLFSTTDADAFTPDDLELLRALASLLAVAVANARMEMRRRTTFLRTMESLATALEARDEYTQGHSQRVCEVSLMIGERMGLSPDALEELRVGTVLHDIGKIGVPDAILNKRGRLTGEEFAVMKQHPVIGYEICRPLLLSEGVLMIIRNHHEKLDGSGYPDGLKGGELPLSLRIVCVADAFDAMSSRRPYRGVMAPEVVTAELSRCAGTQFDPVVVESLKQLLPSERMQALYRQYWTPGEAKAA